MPSPSRRPEYENGITPANKPGGSAPQIPPALKAWLDDVIIPALVREYLSEINAPRDNGVSDCAEPKR